MAAVVLMKRRRLMLRTCGVMKRIALQSHRTVKTETGGVDFLGERGLKLVPSMPSLLKPSPNLNRIPGIPWLIFVRARGSHLCLDSAVPRQDRSSRSSEGRKPGMVCLDETIFEPDALANAGQRFRLTGKPRVVQRRRPGVADFGGKRTGSGLKRRQRQERRRSRSSVSSCSGRGDFLTTDYADCPDCFLSVPIRAIRG